MVARGAGAWQQSATYRQDHARVLALVERVAASRLVFTARDIAREARRTPHLRLTEPAELHRHLQHLVGTVLVDAGPGPLATAGSGAAACGPASSRAEAGDAAGAPARGRRRFVHQRRAEEWAAAGGLASNPEKVFLALAVATLALRQRAVPTITVTRVTRLIDALRLDGTQQTNVLLSALARRSPPLVRREPTDDGRTVAWSLVGDPPADVDLAPWITAVRALATVDGALPVSGAPSRNAQVRRLVQCALAWSVSPDWPQGRPVSAHDLRQCAQQVAEARQLLTAITANGRTLGAALHEAVRRAQAPGVVRVMGPADSRTVWYDLPDQPGAEARAQYANVQLLASLLSEDRLLQLEEERRAAEALYRGGATLSALAAVRLLTVALEVHRAGAVLEVVRSRRDLLGAAPRAAVDRMEARLRSSGRLLTVHEQWVDAAHAALVAVGADPLTWPLAVERPNLTADEYVAYAPAGAFGADTPSTVVARATSVTRFPNPRHTKRCDTDPSRAVSVVLDRPEALLHQAVASRALVVPFLQAGFSLLGRYLRDARLVRPLLDHDDRRVRQSALAALVLLGDEAAAPTAQAWLDEPGQASDVIVSALYALHILKVLEPARLPVEIRRSRVPLVMRTVRAVLDGARWGRWLLQA